MNLYIPRFAKQAAALLFHLSVCGLLFSQEIDSESSRVDFEIENFGINKVKGYFKGMQGSVVFDPQKPDAISFDVCISAETVSSGNKKRDAHLREDDFFNVMYHPEICFVSNKVTPRQTDYVADGTLTLLGISKPAVIVFTAHEKRLVGTMKVNRSDFSLGKGTSELMVGEEARVTIYCYFK
jgi:polyisoprenoid-binding protein YceI